MVILSLKNLCVVSLLIATLGACLPVCVVALKASVCVCVVACKSVCVLNTSGKIPHVVREWT